MNDHGADDNVVAPLGPSSELVSTNSTTPELQRRITGLVEQAARLEENRHAALTRKAYRADMAHFADWCAAMGRQALPATPETVYLYLSALVEADNAADYATSTLKRRLSAIGWVHETSNHPSPTRHARIRELMAGIRRTYGRPAAKADSLTTEQLRRVIDTVDLATRAGLRDRALLLLGYAGAFRRSELAGLRIPQLVRRPQGYVITLVRTKDDQEGQGRQVGIPRFGTDLCPVEALDAWLAAADISNGPVFRRVTRYQTIGTQALSPGAVNLIIKRAAVGAGIPIAKVSGHSLRAGHATTAADNGAPDRTIMRQTGHKHLETLDGYIRSGNVLRDNSALYLGLGGGHRDPNAATLDDGDPEQ